MRASLRNLGSFSTTGAAFCIWTIKPSKLNLRNAAPVKNISLVNTGGRHPDVTFGDVWYEPGEPSVRGCRRTTCWSSSMLGEARIWVDGEPFDNPPGSVALLHPGHQERYRFSSRHRTHHTWCTVRPKEVLSSLRRRPRADARDAVEVARLRRPHESGLQRHLVARARGAAHAPRCSAWRSSKNTSAWRRRAGTTASLARRTSARGAGWRSTSPSPMRWPAPARAARRDAAPSHPRFSRPLPDHAGPLSLADARRAGGEPASPSRASASPRSPTAAASKIPSTSPACCAVCRASSPRQLRRDAWG